MREYLLFLKAFILLLFASFICSMYPWFVWNNYLTFVVTACTFCVALIVFFVKKLYLKKIEISSIVFLIITFSLYLWDAHLLSPIMIAVSLATFFSLLVLFLQEDDFKAELLRFFTKWFGILLLISSISYLLNVLGLFPISPGKIQFGDRYLSNNYYVFIMPQDIYMDYFVRFRSIFMEPGHMAMGTLPLIMANGFNLKNKYVLFIFITNLISFSLVAYIAMGIGYLLMNFSVKKFKYFVIALVAIWLANLVMIQTNNGDMMDEYLWKRLDFSENSEKADRNARISNKYERIYNNTVSRIDLLFWGNDEYDRSDDYGSNAGYKKYIVDKGLFGVLLVLFFYLYAPFSLRTRNSFVFSLVLIIQFIPDGVPLWNCITIPYILQFRSSFIEVENVSSNSV